MVEAHKCHTIREHFAAAMSRTRAPCVTRSDAHRLDDGRVIVTGVTMMSHAMSRPRTDVVAMIATTHSAHSSRLLVVGEDLLHAGGDALQAALREQR